MFLQNDPKRWRGIRSNNVFYLETTKTPKERHHLEQAEVIQKTVLDYDEDADVLYISFGSKPQAAENSDVTDEGVIVRLKRGKIFGLTIPNVKKRVSTYS